MPFPFLGELRMFAGSTAPDGWMSCNGQLVSIAEYGALFQLIGTTYGGDGSQTFALPDLRGRIPIHQGAGFPLGDAAGVEEVTLVEPQMPAHSHPFLAVTVTGDQSNPAGLLPATSLNVVPYINDAPTGTFNADAVVSAGGGQPHANIQPYLCVTFIISMVGAFPSSS